MSKYTPPANATKLTVYGKVIAIYTATIFDDESSLMAVYEENGAWQYLSQPSFYVSDLTTKAATDAIFNDALAEINAAIYATLKPKDPADEPENGIERIEWKLGQLTVVNDVIV